MPSWGKAFTDPFFVMVVVLASTIFYARSRTKKDKRARRALSVALFVTVVTAVIGTDASVRVLERTLRVERESGIPAVIVVPSGGSKPEVLGTASAERVFAAAAWWKDHRRATLMMSGADPQPGGAVSTRTVQLMRDLAIRYGVPASRITVETRSWNTRLHPIEVLRMPGIHRSTPIGLVTSATHMRRARREFRKHFDTVIAHPVIDRRPRLHAGNFIPSSEALTGATRVVHEWIGLAWYALRS